MNQNEMTCTIKEAAEQSNQSPATNTTHNVDVYYITDPLCSHCWALEPTWNRFIEQYGDVLQIQTVMGGLLEDINNILDPSNGIYAPEDVGKHWEEVSEQSRMPISGDIWHSDDPVHSSYPASRVYKIIQQFHPEAAVEFLRRVREAVMVFDLNIAKDEVLIQLVQEMGLHGSDIVATANGPLGHHHFDQDLVLARQLGVHSVPTVLFVYNGNIVTRFVGQRSFQTYVNAIENIYHALPQPKQQPKLADLLHRKQRLYSKEIEVMYGIPLNKVVGFIKEELPDGHYRCDEIHHEMFIEWK